MAAGFPAAMILVYLVGFLHHLRERELITRLEAQGVEFVGCDWTPEILDGFGNWLTFPFEETIMAEMSGASVTEANLALLAHLPNLTQLGVEDHVLSDAEVARILELKGIRKLDLFNTQLDDSGLLRFHGMANLTEVELIEPRVSPAAIKAFEIAVPQCFVIVRPQTSESARSSYR